MDKLLEALKNKVDQAEIYRRRARTIPIEFRSGKLESLKSKETEGIALRVIAKGRLGFSTTTDVADPSVLSNAAIAAAAFGEEAGFSFSDDDPAPRDDVYDKEIADVSEEALVALGKNVIGKLRDADTQVDINLSLTKTIQTVAIKNTSGLNVEEERTHISLSAEIGKTSKGDIFVLFDEQEVRAMSELDPDRLVKHIVDFLRYGKKIVSVESKKLPVVFTPNGTIALLLPLMVGFNGKSVYMGTSPLKGRIGEMAFDPRFSLTDDGTVQHGPRSSAFDDEGTSSSRTRLVSQGTIEGFTYDLWTAALAKAAPTGNGYKGGLLGGGGFRTPPNIGVSNMLVSAGDADEKEIISSIKEGLLVESVLGLGQGNLASGEFSNNVAVAFKIEDGKIVGRVKNTMISGNSYELLKDNLIALGNSPTWALGAVNTPAIAVGGVNVIGQ